MIKKNVTIFILLTILIAVSLLVYNTIKNSREPDIVKVNYFGDGSDIPIMVADKLGIFREFNIELETTRTETGEEAINLLNSNKLDIAGVSSYAFVNSINKCKNIKLISTYVYSYSGLDLVVLNSSEISEVKDLFGKRVGVKRGTQPEFYLFNLLTYYGLLIEDVEIIDLDINNFDIIKKSFDDDVIDAVIAVPPLSGELLKELNNKVSQLEVGRVYRGNINFITSIDNINNKRDLIKRFLMAIEKTNNILEKANDKKLNSIAELIGIDENIFKYILNIVEFRQILDQQLILIMESQDRWLGENNSDNRNYLKYIYVDLLNEINRDSVGIIVE